MSLPVLDREEYITFSNICSPCSSYNSSVGNFFGPIAGFNIDIISNFRSISMASQRMSMMSISDVIVGLQHPPEVILAVSISAAWGWTPSASEAEYSAAMAGIIKIGERQSNK